MEKNELKKITDTYGTPSYIFDLETLCDRLRTIREIIGPDIGLCYSIKANSFLVSAISGSVDKLEVCSPGELSICQRLSVDSSKIIYSGVNKGTEDISAALDYNVGVFTAESLYHVEEISRLASERKMRVPLLLRLTSGNQFGMSKEDIFSAIAARENYPGVDIVGIHYFAGTQRKKAADMHKEIEMLHELYNDIYDLYMFKLTRLEYGPGFSVPYFIGDSFEDTLKPAREIAQALHKASQWADVTIEMGRFISFECGTYLTSVADTKSSNGVNFCIIDGGMNHLNYLGQMMGMKQPIIEILADNTDDAAQAKKWCICGSLCTAADVVVREIPLIGIERGTVLAFKNAGAYSVTEGIYLFLSRMMPRIILRKREGEYELVRDFIDSSIINTINYERCALR